MYNGEQEGLSGVGFFTLELTCVADNTTWLLQNVKGNSTISSYEFNSEASNNMYDPEVYMGRVGTNTHHKCAFLKGVLKCWGENAYGNLGDGTTTERNIPTAVIGLGGAPSWVTTGRYGTCAIVAGAVKCWGNGASGVLGNGGTTTSDVPVQATGLTSGVTDIISYAASNFCAVKNGGVYCWGAGNYNGTLAQLTIPTILAGLPEGTGISRFYRTRGGGYYDGYGLFAITTSGALYSWGLTATYSGSGNNNVVKPITALNSGVTDVARATNSTCAIKSGYVYCWGQQNAGQLANGLTASATVNYPYLVTSLGSDNTSIKAGHDSYCILKSSNMVYCWGENASGQVGNGSTTDQPTPYLISSLSSGVQAIHAGYDTKYAVKDGKTYSWGNINRNGSGNAANTTPLVMPGMSGEVNGFLSSGGGSAIHTCTFKDYKMVCWGYNGNYGIIGVNDPGSTVYYTAVPVID